MKDFYSIAIDGPSGAGKSTMARKLAADFGFIYVDTGAIYRTVGLEMHRKLAREHNVVMDGRDIGTVVLPDADLKIFLTASAEQRAKRRMLELEAKGVDASFDEVLKDIEYRDDQDTKRAAAPLRAAEDAVRVDTSSLNFEESAAVLAGLVIDRLSPKQE